MKYLMLLVVMSWGLMGQSYLQVCEESANPFPKCSGVKIGSGLELVDGEIRIVPTTNGYKIQLDYLVYDSDVSDGKSRTIPDMYQDDTILSVTWGLYVVTKVAPNMLAQCPICWAEATDASGKKALVFSDLVAGNPDKRNWAVVVKFGSVTTE